MIDDFDSDKLGACFVGIVDEISSYNEYYTCLQNNLFSVTLRNP